MINDHNLHLDQANIGIITALPNELAAVRKIFSCTIQFSASDFGNIRTYWLTNVDSKSGGNHIIAIALLVDMGNNMAASRATQMFNDCKNIQYIFMVGIAGAVPSPNKPEDHVRLGDIVVSDRYGVIQHDYGKKTDDKFIHKNAPKPPSADLLSIVKNLQANELLGDRPWENYINNIIVEDSQWVRPSEEYDQLIDDNEAIKHPNDPNRKPNSPKIFLGPIASGNVVLKNASERNTLQVKFQIKAVEMEAAGVADAAWSSNVGYIIVRGTCDYCNQGKNDKWRRYAALIAASYTRAIIEYIPASTPRQIARQTCSTGHDINAENVQVFSNCQINTLSYKFESKAQSNKVLELYQESFERGFDSGLNKGINYGQKLGSQSESTATNDMTTVITINEIKELKGLSSEKGQDFLTEMQSYMMVYEYNKAFEIANQAEEWLAKYEDKLPRQLTTALYEKLANIELMRSKLEESRGKTFDLSKVHFFINKAKKIKNE